MAQDLKGVTIDADHSRDLDDALWVERDGKGWRVTVTVTSADTVAAGSAEDAEARRIGFTRYAGRSVRQTMLPRALSFETLSLLPGQPRRALFVDIRLTADLELRGADLSRGEFRSLARLSHEDAHAMVEDGGDLHPMMADAWELASGLLATRQAAGALAIYRAKEGLLSDEEGHPVWFAGEEHRGHVIVQELMILANSSIARVFAAKGVPLLYRNHRPNPVADRASLLEDLAILAKGGAQSASTLTRLGMMLGRARVGPTAGGHFGLNLPVYAWFTSPIRRYPDLVNHRIVSAHLDGEATPYGTDDLAAIADQFNALSDEVAEERSGFFRLEAERQAREALRRKAPLPDAVLGTALKAAALSGDMTARLADEIEARLAGKGATLTPKELVRALLAEGPASDRSRTAVITRVFRDPPLAMGMLNYARQTLDLQEPRFEETSASPAPAGTFACRAVIDAEGNMIVTNTLRGGTRKEAQQRAAAALLAAMFRMSHLVPGTWTQSGREEVMRRAAASSAPSGPQNPKGTLLELCVASGWPSPTFDTRQSGPSHAPVFECTVTVAPKGARPHSSSASAATRKQAEHLASVELLATLPKARPTVSKASEAAPKGVEEIANPKGALQELCVANGWGLPLYSVIGQQGPAHAPNFTVVATVVIDGDQRSSAPATAGSRKEGERAASKDLLVRLRS